MTDNQKFIAGLIIGAAAGTALAFFLQSDKGKEILGDVKEAAGSAGNSFKSKLAEFDEEFSALLKKGKQFVEDLEVQGDEEATTA